MEHHPDQLPRVGRYGVLRDVSQLNARKPAAAEMMEAPRMPSLTESRSVGLEGKFGDEKRHGEPDPGQQASSRQQAPRQLAWTDPQAQLHGKNAEEHNPKRACRPRRPRKSQW